MRRYILTLQLILILVAAVVFSSTVFAASFTSYRLDDAGVTRTYHVHKPADPSHALPLLVVLHGGGGNGKALKETYGFKTFVEQGEAICVYPDAIEGQWLPEDVSFLDAVIDRVMAQENVDRERLFVTGASRGGVMTFILIARSKHKFLAAGTVIASQIQGLAETYPLTRPISFAMIAGTRDPLMPYDGGWGAMWQPRTRGKPEARVIPVEDTIENVLRVNDISSSPEISSFGDRDPGDGCTNEVRRWTGEDNAQQVMLVKVIGGGHVVPGGRQYLSKAMIGPACNDFDHAKVMFDFFASAESPL